MMFIVGGKSRWELEGSKTKEGLDGGEVFRLVQPSSQSAANVGVIQEFLEQRSRELNTWIIAGSVPLKTADPNKVSNSLLVYDRQGEQVARYDKIFMFDVSLASGESYRESDYTRPGTSCEMVDTPVGKVGLSICYDLRFPEIYRKLVDLGAEVLVVPSAFSPTTGPGHWLPLLKARAIENSCFVVAPAQSGTHNGRRKTWGHTVIIDPWGEVISELETGWGVITADIDPERLQDVRRQLPSLEHRRPDLFDN